MDNYLLYFDSGTSNTRAYLLDRDFQVRYVAKKAVGSKDSAIAGSNRVLIEGMRALHDQVLAENGLGEENISAIYASGMITSPYGLKEVPHLPLPLTVKKFADSLYPFREDTCFHREIILVPGLKTLSDDFSFVNNMRGEEIEIIGALEELKAMDDVQDAAMIFPGSHTHVTYVQGEEITGIISNFTGELFYAALLQLFLQLLRRCLPHLIRKHYDLIHLRFLEFLDFPALFIHLSLPLQQLIHITFHTPAL